MVPDPERIRIKNLQKRIGTELKKIRVRTALLCSLPLQCSNSSAVLAMTAEMQFTSGDSYYYCQYHLAS